VAVKGEHDMTDENATVDVQYTEAQISAAQDRSKALRAQLNALPYTAGDGDPAYSEGIRLRAARDLADMRMTGGWKVLFDGTSPYYVPSNPFAAGPSEYPTDPFVVVNRNGKFLLPEELPRIGI